MSHLTLDTPPAPAVHVARERARVSGTVLVAVSVVVALALLAPLVLVVLDARSAGWGQISTVLFRQRSLVLLEHTVTLSALVAVCSTALGTAAAWATERSRIPLRRGWTVLVVLPVAMPDFVVGWAWHTIDPTIDPLGGAVLVMTLGTYPLVYLPVAAALRRSDGVSERVAHSLGRGPSSTMLRISLPQLAPAALGGAVLVVLTTISEYGTFEILRYSTFTTEIFTQFQFEPPAAGALSIPLVLLGLVVLGGEALLGRQRGRTLTVSVRQTRPAARWNVGSAAVTTALLSLVALGVALPVATMIYWIDQSATTTLPAVATLGQATIATVKYSAAGALVAVVAALPVAMMTQRVRSRTRSVLQRSTFVTQAVPGVVIALSLVFFATRFAFALYQTPVLLVLAYAVLHFPLALVCLQASVTQVSARLADVGTSLGRHPAAVFLRITVPLIAPGLLTGFCLVFLTAITELTATLVLAPIGVQTLATQFWAFQSAVANGAAAPYALVIVGLAIVPGALLGLWFNRETARP